jgi:hypothetical protein
MFLNALERTRYKVTFICDGIWLIAKRIGREKERQQYKHTNTKPKILPFHT